MTLADLHLALQVAFDWTDDHLHAFTAGRRRFGDPRMLDGATDEARVQLRDVLSVAGDCLDYECDFGDSWRHRLIVEKVTDGAQRSIRCLGGRRASPAEDSGGILRWNGMAEAWGDPDHPWSEVAAEWLTSDPALFDKQTIDDRLRRIPVARGTGRHDGISQFPTGLAQ